MILVGVSAFWQVFAVLNWLITFITSFALILWKLKLELRHCLVIVAILGCVSKQFYLLWIFVCVFFCCDIIIDIVIFKLATTFEKDVLNASHNLASFVIFLLPSLRMEERFFHKSNLFSFFRYRRYTGKWHKCAFFKKQNKTNIPWCICDIFNRPFNQKGDSCGDIFDTHLNKKAPWLIRRKCRLL